MLHVVRTGYRVRVFVGTKVQLQNCLSTLKAHGPQHLVVSVVLVLRGVGKKPWPMSCFYDQGD